jgi:uncharacterized protein
VSVNIDELKEIVKEQLSNISGSAHSYAHVERVLKIATYLAAEEGADLEKVQVAALLHDMGRAIGKPHHETGVEPARHVLERIGYPETERDAVTHIVYNHRVGFESNLKTLEGRIVWDADKLDLVGLTGAARAFHFGGESETPFEKVVQWCRNRSTDNPYRFITKTAQRLAEKRYAEMRRFTDMLETELNLGDLKR